LHKNVRKPFDLKPHLKLHWLSRGFLYPITIDRIL
jgi:hypothetical protein